LTAFGYIALRHELRDVGRNLRNTPVFNPTFRGLSVAMLSARTPEVRMRSKSSIFENILVLVLIGILAGAVASLGVGALTGRSSSTTTTSQ